MSRWKIVSQKPVFKAELFDVKEIEFLTKSGEKKVHHQVERNPIVSVFPLTDSYEIYLISQYRYMLKTIVLEAVAGNIEKKETTLEAAKRELKEETGIIAGQWEEIARAQIGASVLKAKIHLFLAKELEMGQAELQDGEEITLVKMSLNQAVKKVMTGEINHAASMVGILMLDQLRSQKKL